MRRFRSSWIWASVAGVTLIQGHAFAAVCRTLERPWPGIGPSSDIMTIECQLTGLANASAQVAASRSSTGLKETKANLLTGANQIAKAFGLDSSGGIIASCTATDATPGNGASNPVNCPTGIQWRGEVSYNL